MKILFLAQDLGPSRNLARIAVEAMDRGHTVKSALFVPLDIPKILDFTHDCDTVVFSPGTLKTYFDAEFVIRAKNRGKKLTCFMDTHGQLRRYPFSEVTSLFDFAFVPDEKEKEQALMAGFKKVVVTGVPLWEDFCKPPRYTNDDIRMTLGIKKDERVVIFSGTKNGKITKNALYDLLSAMSKFNDPWMLFPRFHPGDENFEDRYYDSLPSSIGVRWMFSNSLFPNIGDLLPAADLVISLFSTVGIEAVYKRKRVIDYLPPYVCDRLEELTGERIWNPAELGATRKAESQEGLVQAMKHLFTDEGFADLRKNQEKFYPLIEQGSAARCVMDAFNG